MRCFSFVVIPLTVHCPSVNANICGKQGGPVTAAAYLDAHYELNPNGCNSQVVVPWLYLARFAGELTIQSSIVVFEPEYRPGRNEHMFKKLFDRWQNALQKGLDTSDKQRFKVRTSKIPQFFEPIDRVDCNGLMFRYPMGCEGKAMQPLPENLEEHCQWPHKIQQLIATFCDITLDLIDEDRINCINAFRHLRATAACGGCLGDFDQHNPISPDNEYLNIPVDQIEDKFDSYGHSQYHREHESLAETANYLTTVVGVDFGSSSN